MFFEFLFVDESGSAGSIKVFINTFTDSLSLLQFDVHDTKCEEDACFRVYFPNALHV